MKKLGLLGLVLLIALGAMGAGYAIWLDTVYIHGHIDTGEVKIGIRDTGTSDPVGTLDPMRAIEFGGAVVPSTKDVADTTSTNGNYKCYHSGVDWYDSMTYRYENVYPGYAPTVYYEICNCGTIPVHLTFSDDYSGDINLLQYMDIVHWTLDLDGVEFAWGDDAVGLCEELDGYQLHPCHYLSVEVEVHFYTNDLPQNHYLDWIIDVTGTQWNAP